MGIRGLLGFLLKSLDVLLINRKRRGFVVSAMYVDAIQFVYKALNSIKAEALFENRLAALDDETVINKTIEKMLDLIKEIAPRHFLGIYFDGIPPLAKVVEQRARRYEMSLTPSSFNNAKITIGTSFLTSLVKKLLVALHDSQLNIEIEVSTPLEPGEGEHKIMARLKSSSLTGAKVIVSDDGDVLIMSLLNKIPNCFIYIDHPPPSNKNGFISIENLSQRIKSKLNDTPTAINDFCLMVILTGSNDFMPRIQATRDRSNCLTEMLDIYSTHIKTPLLDKDVILWPAVRSLIVQLAANEERDIRRLAELTKKELDGKMPELYSKSRDPNTGQIKLMYFRKAWDEMIYEIPEVENLSIPKPTAKEIDLDHTNSAILYLQGLEWTLNYMRTGSGPDWYFIAPYPPLFNDISKVMSQTPYSSFILPGIPSWKPLSLPVYLLTILPKATTRDLFGESFANVFGRTTYLADLFPLSFKHFAPAEWVPDMKGKAILPPLDLDRLKKVADEKLDKDVIERYFTDLEPRLKLKKGEQWKVVKRSKYKEENKVLPIITTYKVLDVIIPSLSSY